MLKRDPWAAIRGWLMVSGRVMLGCGAVLLVFTSLALAVAVGTALGNGIPMARSASESFRQGVQTGMQNCPCNKKAVAGRGPTPLEAGPVRLSPVPEVVRSPEALKLGLTPVADVVK